MEINSSIKKKIKKNNRSAILKLYNQSFDSLMSIAVRYYVNEEDRLDMVNTSFIKIINHIDQYEIGTNYVSWIKMIGRNTVIDKFRKEKNYKQKFKELNFETNIDIENLVENPEEIIEWIDSAKNEEIDRILNLLPPTSKIIFNLFAIEEYTYKEIASKLSISYETVKWHIKESRKVLRANLKINTLEIE